MPRTKVPPKKRPKARKPAPAAPAPMPLRLEWRTPAELAENPSNWRRHPPAQLSALTDAIAEVGWAGACLYNERTGRLIDGHARRKVALEQGTERVPVLVGDWSEEAERKILATLDPISALATADSAALDALLRQVQTGSEAVAELLKGIASDAGLAYGGDLPQPGAGGDEFDATPADGGPTRTALGNLWLIRGNGVEHRLLVGDCTAAENVARVMGGEKAGLCFTSPPYAQQRDYGEAAKEQVQDWYALMCGASGCLPMADDGQVLVNLGLVHRDGEWVPYWEEWIAWMREQGWRRFGWYVWDKGFSARDEGGRLSTSHEWVYHFNRVSVDPHKWIECETAGRVEYVPAKYSDREGQYQGKDRLHQRNSHRIAESIVRVNRGASRQTEHPAAYPIELPSFFMRSWPGDVYDPFLGSGTTLIAAHRLGRRASGCELEPKYADVILRRCEAEGLACEKSDE